MSVTLKSSIKSVQSTIIFSKFLGNLEKRETKKGFMCNSCSYKTIILAALCMSLFAVMCLFANPTNLPTKSYSNFLMSILSTIVTFVEGFLLIFSVIPLLRCYLYFIAKYDFEISQMELELPPEFYKKLKFSTNWTLIECFILMTTRLNLLFTYRISLLQVVAYFAFFFCGSMIKYLMIMLWLQIRKRFDHANNEISSLRSYLKNTLDIERMQMLTQKLYNLNRMHYKLCRIISKLNSSASFLLFFCLFSTAIYLVVLSFRVYLHIFHQDAFLNTNQTYVKALILLIMRIYELQTFVANCVRLCRSANKAPVLLHQLRNKMSSYNVELDGHIQLYSLQLFQQKVYISTLGFFELDYSLIFSMFGGVTTYLTILIQFDISFVEISGEALSNFTTSTILPENL